MISYHVANDNVQRDRFGEELANSFDPFFEFLFNFIYDVKRLCFVSIKSRPLAIMLG